MATNYPEVPQSIDCAIFARQVQVKTFRRMDSRYDEYVTAFQDYFPYAGYAVKRIIIS